MINWLTGRPSPLVHQETKHLSLLLCSLHCPTPLARRNSTIMIFDFFIRQLVGRANREGFSPSEGRDSLQRVRCSLSDIVSLICQPSLSSPRQRIKVCHNWNIDHLCHNWNIDHLCHNWNIGHFCHNWIFPNTTNFSVTTGTLVTSVTIGSSHKLPNSLSEVSHFSGLFFQFI